MKDPRNIKDYENLREILGKDLGEALYSVVNSYYDKKKEDYTSTEVIKEASERMNMTLHDGHFKTNSETSYVQIGANNVQPNKQSILKLIEEL